MYTVSDMLLTAHALRRDYFSKIALAIDLAALVLSIAAISFSFYNADQAAPQDVFLIGIEFLPIIGLITFVLTIIQLRTNPKGKSDQHSQAYKTLTTLKFELSEFLLKSDSQIKTGFPSIRKYYTLAMNSCPAIPENVFLKAKAIHRTKIRISKILDKEPNSSIALLKIKLWINDNFRKIEKYNE